MNQTIGKPILKRFSAITLIGVSDIPHINSDAYPPMYYFFPEITLSSVEGSEVMGMGDLKDLALPK